MVCLVAEESGSLGKCCSRQKVVGKVEELLSLDISLLSVRLSLLLVGFLNTFLSTKRQKITKEDSLNFQMLSSS